MGRKLIRVAGVFLIIQFVLYLTSSFLDFLEQISIIPLSLQGFLGTLSTFIITPTSFTLPAPYILSLIIILFTIFYACFVFLVSLFFGLGIISAGNRFDKASGVTAGYFTLFSGLNISLVNVMALFAIPLLFFYPTFQLLVYLIKIPYYILMGLSTIASFVALVGTILFGISLIFIGKTIDSGFVKAAGIIVLLLLVAPVGIFFMATLGTYLFDPLSPSAPFPSSLLYDLVQLAYRLGIILVECIDTIFIAGAFFKMASSTDYF
ncbi:MAG: hypothetical protein ACTSRB_13080 [Candidatus Helarchaeota archaeon]